MAEKYDFIFSLGAIPITSELLKELELQIFDFPFDRISGSDFFTRMSMFLLDCNNFIQQKDISVQKDTPVKDMVQYKDLRTNFIYHSDFNPDIPVENSFPTVKLRYDTYIKNLKRCINAGKKILIVYVEDPQQREDEEENASLIMEASQKLKDKYPNKEFRILYARNDEDVENIKVIKLGNNAEKIAFNFYRKFSDASAYYIDASMLSMIFAEIGLKKSWRQKKIFYLSKIMKFLSRFT